MQSQMLLRVAGEVWLRYDLQWLVVFHYRQNQQTYLVDFVAIISEMNQNCFPKRTRPSSKIATSLGAHLQKGEMRVTGFRRMSRSRFLQICVMESRQISIGRFLRQGLILKIQFWGWRVWRMGRLLCFRRMARRGTKGWSSIWQQDSIRLLYIFQKFGLTITGFWWASCLRLFLVYIQQIGKKTQQRVIPTQIHLYL